MPTETLPWNSSGSFAPDLDFHDDGSYEPEPYQRKVNPRYPVDIPGARDSDWASGWMKGGCGCGGKSACSCGGGEKEACCGACAEGLPCQSRGGEWWGSGYQAQSFSTGFMDPLDRGSGSMAGDGMGNEGGGEFGCCRLDAGPPLTPMSLVDNSHLLDPQTDAAACQMLGGIWDYELCPPWDPEEKRCGPKLMEHLVRTLKDCRRWVAKNRMPPERNPLMPDWSLPFNAGLLLKAFKDKGPFDLNEAEKPRGFATKGKNGEAGCPTHCDSTVSLCKLCLKDQVPENILFGFCGAAAQFPDTSKMLHSAADVIAGGDTSESHLAIDLGIALSSVLGRGVELQRIPLSWNPETKKYEQNWKAHEKNLDKQLKHMICAFIKKAQSSKDPKKRFKEYDCPLCPETYKPSNYKPPRRKISR